MGYGSRIASKPAQVIRLDYSGTNVTSAAYVQLTGTVNNEMVMAEIVDTGGNDMKLAIGPAGGEVDIYAIPGNQSKHVPMNIGKQTRLAVKAYGTSNTTGSLIINLFV